ncbi:hypothetical protein [Pleionea sediminis]|uniref:hypothetical protein n=1 Tax=Pleionea sediminis TaxID=2569479 RepID=UPI001185F341|nr:hypothetical protein [Pleionea sediminis]
MQTSHTQLNNSLPVSQLLFQTVSGIAEAQAALDASSVTSTEMMSGKLFDEKGQVLDTRIPIAIGFEEGKRKQEFYSLFELGFVPTFYQFVETVIELKVSMRLRDAEEEMGILETTPIDATYINRYNFNMRGASVINVKVKPVPPPPNIDRLTADEVEEDDRVSDLEGPAPILELFSKSSYLLGSELSVLSGVPIEWKDRLNSFGISELSDVLDLETGFVEQLNDAEKREYARLELKKKVQAVCFPEIYLPDVITLDNSAGELFNEPDLIPSLNLDGRDTQALKQYLLILDTFLDSMYFHRIPFSKIVSR